MVVSDYTSVSSVEKLVLHTVGWTEDCPCYHCYLLTTMYLDELV